MSEIDWSEKFPRLTPAKAPALMRINGCGTGLYGRRDYDDETGTWVATLCLSLLFIPVLCLRAYRVARAPQGWYFLGREPLSAAARAWNGLLLAGILVAIGVGKYDAYTSTPEYNARHRMAAAHKLADGGHLARAAKVYQDLALAGADQAVAATNALKALLDGPCRQAPLDESAGVYACAARVARQGHALSPAEVVDGGLKLASEKGDADPRDGVALLDAVRPLVTDTRLVNARRLGLLREWAAAEPGNYDEVIYPLASLLEQQGQVAEAKKLLVPVKDRLGGSEGARVLGTVLGREGDYDGAYALLWPYVKGRLDNLHAAEKAAEEAVERIQRREIGLLKDDKGPPGFAERLQSAGTDQRRTMVREYVNGRIRSDPEFLRTREALERESAVVPVALELGIVMLQRAQSQADPAARKAQLESAEKVFLAIGGVAGETDEYRLSLGQVYYWLGRQSEGRKLFDDFLASKGRGFADLTAIARRLRQLGAVPEARAMAEEAYNKTSQTDEQHQAAWFRAACNTDADDRDGALRARGGRTAAVALCRRADELVALDLYTGAADADKAVALAEEAHRLAPSAATSGNLTTVLLFRAAGALRRTDPAFETFYAKYGRSVGVPCLLAFAAGEPGPFQQEILRHPDVRKAIDLVREDGRLFPGSWSAYEWALLRGTDPGEADKAAESIRGNPRKPVELSIAMLLGPADAVEAMEAYWMGQIQGRPEEGREALRRVAALGVPVPVGP